MDLLDQLADNATAGGSHFVCSAVDDIRTRLDALLQSKTSDGKAEYTTATFKLPASATLRVVVTETENAALDAAAALDPSPGGIRLAGGVSGQILALGNGSYQRPIHAHDAIANQPQDSPFLQRAAARSITAALSPANELGSSWAPRTISRASAGWTFEYNCKNSLSEWKRQYAKGQAPPVVGLSSGKDGQDPVNMCRPAFDCRGSMTITFNKQAKQIEIKYRHTPLHRTVAELLDFFTPPAEPSTHKRPLEESAAAVEGETPHKKKRRKSQKSADQEGGGSEGAVNGDAADGAAKATPKKRVPKPKKPRTPATTEPEPADAAADKGGDVVAVGPGGALLNLPPGEAIRRRDVANSLLSASGIDPATLSQEQFNIFSNQSPDLQQESLAMLVKYGAERLRIVHPTVNKDAQSSQSDTGGSAESSPTPETPSSTAKRRKSGKSGAGSEAGAAQRTPKAKTPKLTRGRCDGCKDRNIKCSKNKPSCSECQDAGMACVYQLEQTKGPRGQKSDRLVEESPGADEHTQELQVPDEPGEQVETQEVQKPDEQELEGQEPGQEPEQESEEQEPEGQGQEQDDEEEEPDDLLPPGFGQPSATNDWNQAAAPDLSTYHNQVEAVPTTTGLEFSQNLGGYVDGASIQAVEEPPSVETSPEVEHMQHAEPIQHSQPVQQPTTRVTRSSGGRHSLPTGQPPKTATVGDATSSSSVGWHLPVASAPGPMTSALSTADPDAADPGHHLRSTMSRTALQASDYASQAMTHHGLRGTPPLPQAAAQRPSEPSPEVQYQQPVSQPSRSSSRQSQRPLSQSAHAIQSSSHDRQQQQQQQHHQTQAAATMASSNGPSTAAAETRASKGTSAQDPYAQYYNNVNTTSNTTTAAADQGNTGIAYTPYSSQSGAAATSAYNYDTGYNTRSHAPQSYSNPVTRPAVSASYTTAGATNTSQWLSQTAQTRNPQMYNMNANVNSATSASSNERRANPGTANPSALQGVNIRQPSNSPHTRSTSRASYHQQQRQQQHQTSQVQPQQAQPQRQQPQHQGYGSYLLQPQHSSSASHQQRPQQRQSQQQQQQQQQQQSWYGFNAANSSGSGYGAANSAYEATHSGSGPSSYVQQHQHQHQQQNHRSMTAQGNTYGSIDASAALYNLLPNN